ncbi:DUF6207 family protein [Streptomyces chryseus]
MRNPAFSADVPVGMEHIRSADVSEPGLAVVEILAGDMATLEAIAERLSGAWASSGSPVIVGMRGQGAVCGRVHLDVRLPPPGHVRKLPAEWVRFYAPPWGGRLGFDKPLCVRARRDCRPCTRQAAEWPQGYVEMEDPGACWTHLDETERHWCLRARQMYTEAFWAMKRAHQEAAGHGRDEQCGGCTWLAGEQPAAHFCQHASRSAGRRCQQHYGGR